jgi:hypothetical protein
MPTSDSSSFIVDSSLSKGRRIALYVLLGLISAFYLFIGGQKVIGVEGMVSRMAEIHYPPWATRLIGIVEVTAVLALWWRRSRTLALSALILVMAGAAGSHIAFGHPASQWGMVFGFAAALGVTMLVGQGEVIWRFLFRLEAGPSASGSGSTGYRVARYGLLGLLSLWMLFLGGQKLFAIEPMASNMAEINFGGWPMHLIGFIEVVAVGALWWRRGRTAALVLLLPIIAGGAGAHLGAGQGMARAAGAFITAAVIGITLFVERGQGLWRFLAQRWESRAAAWAEADARVEAAVS